MKKRIVLSIGLIVMMLLTGCQKQVVLTEEESDMFAEYISKVVLKRDKHYDQGLVDYEYYLNAVNGEEEEEEEQKPTTSPTDNSQSGKPEVQKPSSEKDNETHASYVDADLNDIFDSKIKVAYDSYQIYDSYPKKEDSYFVIESKKGYKLVVVNFKLKNSESNPRTFDLLSTEIKYQLSDGSGNVYQPLMTLLINDMQFMNKSIAANSTENAVLVFRVESAKTEEVKSLQITSGSKRASIALK